MEKTMQKVLFVQETGNGELEIESIWCIKQNDSYIIDNIPFIAKRIALGDTIAVEYDESEKAYYFDDFVAVSGNTTVRLYFDDRGLIEPTRKALEAFGCASEAFLQRDMIAVNVPKNVEYNVIKRYLDEGEKQNKWDYEESCLAHQPA